MFADPRTKADIHSLAWANLTPDKLSSTVAILCEQKKTAALKAGAESGGASVFSRPAAVLHHGKAARPSEASSVVQERRDDRWQALGKQLFALDVGAAVTVTKLELNPDDSMCPGGLRLDAAVQVGF